MERMGWVRHEGLLGIRDALVCVGVPNTGLWASQCNPIAGPCGMWHDVNGQISRCVVVHANVQPWLPVTKKCMCVCVLVYVCIRV